MAMAIFRARARKAQASMVPAAQPSSLTNVYCDGFGSGQIDNMEWTHVGNGRRVGRPAQSRSRLTKQKVMSDTSA
jgi:hypothetical protein